MYDAPRGAIENFYPKYFKDILSHVCILCFFLAIAVGVGGGGARGKSEGGVVGVQSLLKLKIQVPSIFRILCFF